MATNSYNLLPKSKSAKAPPPPPPKKKQIEIVLKTNMKLSDIERIKMLFDEVGINYKHIQNKYYNVIKILNDDDDISCEIHFNDDGEFSYKIL